MATLLLAAAGSAAGGAIGGTLLGVSAAAIGQAVGASIGQVIDRALFAQSPGTTRQEGPRLNNLSATTSVAGAPLPDIWGRTAVSGQIIWGARLREIAATDTQRVGSGKSKGTVQTTRYRYTASFAVSLGEGPVRGVNRIWADGRLLDITDLRAEGRLRFYPGSETQGPDPLIAATEGSAPAFRGTAYLVFEDLPLDDFGNRRPTLKVEVITARGDLEPQIRGVNLIPGATEWGYDPQVTRLVEKAPGGAWIATSEDNATRYPGRADMLESLDLLDQVLPNAETVSLVVSWFGTDMRAGQCVIEPRIEFRNRSTDPVYEAGGRNRLTVNEVSRDPQGRPAYGSTPADAAVIRAIQHLKARGKRVVLYPFIMMDVTAAQGLPHPSGTGTQPDYPWRGRIEPAAGADVGVEVAAFLGGATAAQFSVSGGSVSYSGPDDGGFRRFILWMAALAKAAGGVDAFLVGTEMRGMTFATPGGGSYPFVDGLVDLAAEARSLLGAGVKISYAADWSEYHSHRPADGSGDVFFHLDPLWSSPNVDFVGIDNYLPLSDWRPGTDHADWRPDGPTSPYDLDYLKGNIEGGEYWDFFYADRAARDAQDRTPITPGPEAWVFRQKAFRDWHGNAHYDRPGGVRDATPTAWAPGSKPIWFTEIGCPAVTFGANQPNVFSARLSSESFLPFFSDGARDDFMQRQYLRAWHEWIEDNGGAIVDRNNVQVWCWDARPWPEFPQLTGKWVDGVDWRLGHWLNGRAGAAPLAEIARGRIARHGLTASDLDLSRAWGQADGYAIPGPTSWRDVVQPFEVALAAALVEEGGRVVVESRAAPIRGPALTEDDLAETGAPSPWALTRSALEDAPQAALLRFRDGLADYDPALAQAAIGAGRERGVAEAETPLVLDNDRGLQAAERMLREAGAGREALSASLPRSRRDIRPGMVLPITLAGLDRLFLVERVTDGEVLEIEGRAFDAAAFAGATGAEQLAQAPPVFGSSAIILTALDLPILYTRPEVAVWDGYLAAHAQPFPGGVDVIRATTSGGAGAGLGLEARTMIGETVAPVAPGRPWTWDETGAVEVLVYSGAPLGRPRAEVLAGRNVVALDHGDDWEILQFAEAELIGANTWRLTDLVRGARGTETLAAQSLPAGARVVFLSGAVEAAGLAAEEVGRPQVLRYGPAGADPITFAEQTHTFRGVGRRPFAPARLAAEEQGGDTVLTWARRARSAGGFTISTAPPLGEATESYRVEIGPEGAPVRVETTAAPAFTYTAAMQTADGVSAPFEVRVAQVSETWGAGTPATLTVET